jgi:Tol biopolymer transport system component
MKYTWPFLLLLLLSQCTHPKFDHEHSAPYPTPLPDSTPITFLQGIVSADSLDFNANFSPNGKSFYFSRNINGKTHLYVSPYDGKAWAQPEMLPFCEPAFSEADPFTTDDGTLYYISDRRRNAEDTIPDYDIWCVHPLENGKWSAPENVAAVNSDSTEYYVSLADNGNLYFASNRAGSAALDIYVSKFVDGRYMPPENLGPLVNAPENDFDPFISGDEKLLIFTSSKRKDGFGKGDLYYSEKGEDGKWTPSKNLGNRINTASYDFCPHITRDQKYFFYSSNNDVKWMEAKYLPVKWHP